MSYLQQRFGIGQPPYLNRNFGPSEAPALSRAGLQAAIEGDLPLYDGERCPLG